MAKKTKANRVMGISMATERDWQAESDCDTLVRAAEIKRDAKRLKAAQACAKKRLMENAAVAGSDADGDKD